MEIDITTFFENEETTNYSNSIANSGLNNIGEITWNNAKNCDYEFVTENNRNEFLKYFLEFGSWEKEEINSIIELNALFIQLLSSNIQDYKFEIENDIPEDERNSMIFYNNKYYFELSH